MEQSVEELNQLARDCDCGNLHYLINIEQLIIEQGAIHQAARYVKNKKFLNVVMIADQNTYEAAGKVLEQLLETENITCEVCLIDPNRNGDVIADEQALVQALLATSSNTDVLLAVGSGTIHDITRFSSFKMGKPFISIPTAASVDGFTSMGAPIIIKGEKKTYQTQSPLAVFADLTILMKAPAELRAAGFGDMLAKHTSLADWQFSSLIGGEPFCPLTADMTKSALKSCERHIEQIAAGEEEGLFILTEALILSGLAMLIFGHSHPASGGEHHLSHYWEMMFLKEGRPQVLHGEKVAVATAYLADIYKQNFSDVLENSSRYSVEDISTVHSKIQENNHLLEKVVDDIPTSFELTQMINQVRGTSSPKVLGISNELLEDSLKNAYHLRDRFTILKFLNTNKGTEFINH